MNHIELQEKYPTTYLEVKLSKNIVKCTQNNTKGVVLIKVSPKGVFLVFGRNGLCRGEDVMYPKEEYKGKLVPYKYPTNFKTIDLALEEWKKWEKEFTTYEENV